MKKRISAIFILLTLIISSIIFSGFTYKKVYADSIETVSSSKSALLMDANSKTIIFEKNSKERLPIASMCKVMTLIVCFDNIREGVFEFGDLVTVSENAAGMGGSQVFLEKNAEYSVGELIKSIVVASANDACVAMAERICGSEQAFVEKMNEKASQLNMENTNFVNCTGLPKVGHYSCAEDVAKMFSCLIENEEYFRFSRIWTDVVKHPNDRITEISNTNKLIRFYKGCDGGKTGYTSEAGHCLVACAKRGDTRLISVIIKAPDSKTRFKEASSMFNYGFDNYVSRMIVDTNKPLNFDVKVLGGKKDNLEIVASQPLYLFSNKNQKRSVEFDFVLKEKIKAPVQKGQSIGELVVYENGVEIATINVVSNENIEKKGYIDNVKDVIDNWGIV